MDRVFHAVDKFSEGYACSQAVLSAYCELFNLDTEHAMSLTAGFAGGMRYGKTCGVVSGAYMVIGLRFGGEDCVKAEGRKKVYRAVSEFIERFEHIHGSTYCEGLLGCNISTAEGMRKAKEENLFKTRCPGFVKSSIELLEELCSGPEK